MASPKSSGGEGRRQGHGDPALTSYPGPSSSSASLHSGVPPAPSGSSTVLDFNEAMSDFKTMFPEMDDDVIEMVLRANNGAVDASIDNLLAMTSDNAPSNDSGRNPEASMDPPSYHQALKTTTQDLINLDCGSEGAFSSYSSSEAPHPPPAPTSSDLERLGAAGGSPRGFIETGDEAPTKEPVLLPSLKKGTSYNHPSRREKESEIANLPVVPTQQMLQNKYEENLRMREEVRTGLNPAESAATSQYLEDERVALMLQNEEFMSELRRDQEFINALESDYTSGVGTNLINQQQPRSSKIMDEAVFREKLKNMGKTSKRKFSQLAGMFTGRKSVGTGSGSGTKQLLAHAQAPSKDNLLLNPENLVENDDDQDTDENQKNVKTKSKGSGGKYSSFS